MIDENLEIFLTITCEKDNLLLREMTWILVNIFPMDWLNRYSNTAQYKITKIEIIVAAIACVLINSGFIKDFISETGDLSALW